MRTSPRYFIPFVLGLAWAGCISASNNTGNGGGDAAADGADVAVTDGTSDGARPDSGDASSSDADVAQPDAPADTATDVATDTATDGVTPDTLPVDAAGDATADTATDSAADAASEAAVDAGTDAPVDAATDVRLDATTDTAVDAAADAPADTATDMSTATDATSDGGTDASAADAVSDGAADVVVCTPTTETCNGRDDNCNGIIDESGCGAHLLITEVVVGPTEAEFVEIHNPTSAAIDLSNYYLSDFHDYACLLGRTCTITGRTAPTAISTSDFVARFPAGATIAPGGYVVVSTSSPERFAAIASGRCPNYYLPASGLMVDGGTVPLGPCSAAVAMRGAPTTANTVGSSAGLTNGGELAILFRWDGMANLVEDVDYVFWGAASTSNLQVDKSGTSAMGTAYRADTVAAMQQRVAAPDNGAAAIRCNYVETGERTTGGNGLGGHDETSEPLMTTWRTTVAPVVPDGGMLTSISATPGAVNDCR